MKREYYFAYGSNMDEEQMAVRCPEARFVAPGFLPIYRFAIDRAGVATVIRDPASFVQGIVWSVTRNDIRNLDLYEGIDLNCYRKETLSVVLPNKEGGVFIEPLVYVSCRPEWDKPTGTGSEYMRRILASAAHYDFRPDYMHVLIKYAETNIIRVKRKASTSRYV